MVTLRGIVLCAVIALSLLGACRDVPIDDGSATVIPKDEPPYTPLPDSCPDCVAGHKRPSVRLMRLRYYKGFGKWDSVSINLLDTNQDQVCAMDVESRSDGSLKVKLHIEASIPLIFGSTYQYWGVRDVVVNIPEIVVDGQGRCNAVDLRSDPLENEKQAGISIPYRYNYSGTFWQVYETIKVATGDRNHGFFKITGVDPRGRFLDAQCEVEFHFPDSVYQNIPQQAGYPKPEKVRELNLQLGFRLALTP
jgi:hypothetical protein